MNHSKTLVAGVLLCAVVPTVYRSAAQDQPYASAAATSVDRALASFLIAFDNLDWPAFRACFCDDATVFHPAAPNVKRTNSPDEFERAWLSAFERIRKASGRNASPYMDLKPQDLQIQRLSEDVALVTFHLRDGNTIGRRTLVLRRRDHAWQIVHIHASNIVATPLAGSDAPK